VGAPVSASAQPPALTRTRDNPFLARLRADELTLMLGLRVSRTADILRIAHSTGHHAVMIDLEHSMMSLQEAAALCATAADLGMTPLVRVAEKEYGAIGRLLDGGAHGIVFPRVETAAEAVVLSRACRFPPQGQRSQTTMVPQFGMRPTPAAALNPELDALTIVQILVETPLGVANADEIAAVEGVDLLAIGANDLTAELGVPGDYRDPRFRDAVETVARACQRHGKMVQLAGIGDLSLVESFLLPGVCPLYTTGMDTDLLFSAARDRAHTYAAWRAAQRAKGDADGSGEGDAVGDEDKEKRTSTS
jgi:2-keto-3-deoxy-L-rhamnonate aldolase RhmA